MNKLESLNYNYIKLAFSCNFTETEMWENNLHWNKRIIEAFHAEK